MFEKILFPTDFSEPSKHVLGLLANMRTECRTQTVVLVHVVDTHSVDAAANLEGFYSISLDNIRDDITREFRRQAESALESLKRDLHQHGYEVETMVAHGDPAEEIVAIAADKGVGCIVMGSRGRSKVAELLLGSVSDKVIRAAKCPVLIMK